MQLIRLVQVGVFRTHCHQTESWPTQAPPQSMMVLSNETRPSSVRVSVSLLSTRRSQPNRRIGRFVWFFSFSLSDQPSFSGDLPLYAQIWWRSWVLYLDSVQISRFSPRSGGDLSFSIQMQWWSCDLSDFRCKWSEFLQIPAMFARSGDSLHRLNWLKHHQNSKPTWPIDVDGRFWVPSPSTQRRWVGFRLGPKEE